MKISDIKSQKGGLLVEALAILGIVAVTSPMIYKKKIDKAQELDDVAKASQMKIIKEAVANYIDAKYDTYLNADGSPKKTVIKLNEISDFLPPGFDNDDSISIGIRGERVNGTDRVSAIVVDSEKFNEKRGNRIASLIGADGGYAGADGNATGNNSVWTVNPFDFGFAEGAVTSQIVSTTQFSKSAASGEYLYKYKVEGMPQVNTMMTNINMRGNDLNNAASVGLQFGKNDNFNSWRLNGYENEGQQYGDGTIVGKNRSGFDTVALQANRRTKNPGGADDKPTDIAGVVDAKGHNSLELYNGGNDTTDNGSGALTLRAMKAGGTVGGCTEALAKSDIGVGDGAGVFTACNNNTSRTAYLIANSEKGHGGELRLRTDGKDAVGATVYSDANLPDNRGGAAFEATDADGNTTVSMAAEKQIMKPHRYDGVTPDTDKRSSLELGYGKKIQVTATSDKLGGALYFRDTGKTGESADKQGNHAVELIGDEALATVRDVNGTGAAAGLTGDYRAGVNGKEDYFDKTITEPTKKGRGAFFVRSKNGSNPDAQTIALVSGQESGGSEVGANMILHNGESRGLRATSIDGGAMYIYNGGQQATVAVEGKRHLGTVALGSDTDNGYAEVRASAGQAAEMYSNIAGTNLNPNGNDGDNAFSDTSTNSGGAYLGYHGGNPNVKFMASGGHSATSGNNIGGVLDLSDSGKKAILTATADSETLSGGVGSAMRLSTGDTNYAHFGANGESSAGEMVLKGAGGTVTAYGKHPTGGAVVLSNSGKKETVKVTTEGNDGTVAIANENGNDRVVFKGGSVTAYNESNKGTATINNTGLTLTNSDGEKRVSFATNALEYYNPSNQKAVFSNGSLFQSGLHSNGLQIDVTDGDDSEDTALGNLKKGVDSMKSGEQELLGAILIGGGVTTDVANAAVLKTDGDFKFKDICILGKTDDADNNDYACLADAAAAEAEIVSKKTITKDTWLKWYGDLSTTDQKPGVTNDGKYNFGRALWQLIAARVTDKMESSQHNDTHHLYNAWKHLGSDKFKVSGTTITGGTAYLPGASSSNPKAVEYLDDKAGYLYMTKDDSDADVKASLALKYYNIEKGDFENLKQEITYHPKRYNTSAEGNGYIEGGETQFSAAGHEHGATWKKSTPHHYPVYSPKDANPKNGWGGGRDSKETNENPYEPEQYVVMGHYHLNYKCEENNWKYMVRKIDYSVHYPDEATKGFKQYEHKMTQADCDKYLDGPGDGTGGKYFYQGTGSGAEVPSASKWNKYDSASSGGQPKYEPGKAVLPATGTEVSSN